MESLMVRFGFTKTSSGLRVGLSIVGKGTSLRGIRSETNRENRGRVYG